MTRVPLVDPATMTIDQRRVYDKVISGPRGAVVGPLRAALHSPELAERWESLGEYLRFRTSLAPCVSELAILVTARRWNAQVEWHIHAAAARKAGLADAIIEAIRAGQAPRFADPGEALVYDYARELQEQGRVSTELYHAAERQLGTVGIVELTALIGYYTMVAMTLNAHEIPLPGGQAPPLAAADPGNGATGSLTKLAPAIVPPG